MRGDTIIEVLLAITVVSTVLGGAYASSNQSLNLTRQSQERGESLKLAEQQLERLKTLANTNSGIFSTDYFCIHEDLTYSSIKVGSLDFQNFGAYPGECQAQPQGGATYYIVIHRTDANTFAVHSTWPRIGGGNDSLKLAYRVYP